MRSGVYEIRNSVNGSRYIGSSADVQKRLRGHANALRTNTHPNPHLLSAYRKYGKKKFVYSPLLYCDPSMALIYEQMCLDGMQSEYNIAKDATAPMRGRVHTNKTKRKMSRSQAGNRNSLGHKQTKDHKEKIREAAKGREFSDVHKKHLSDAGKGRKHSNETKKRLSKAMIGRKLSKEHKEKVSRSLKGNKRALGMRHTEETKAKMSKANKGRKQSDAHKAKRFASLKLYWAKKRGEV